MEKARIEPINDQQRSRWSDPGLLSLVSLLVVVGIMLADYAFQAHGQAKYLAGAAAALTLLGGVTIAGGVFRFLGRLDRERLAELRADNLPKRAKRAANALLEATTLVEELQAELTARAALLEDIKQQVANTTQRAADMERLSAVDDQAKQILDAYFDETLKHRFEEFEQTTRKRDWLIGTVIAVMVGVIAILFSHFVFGF